MGLACGCVYGMIQVVSCDQYNAYVCLASRLGQECMGWECSRVYDLQIMPPHPDNPYPFMTEATLSPIPG